MDHYIEVIVFTTCASIGVELPREIEPHRFCAASTILVVVVYTHECTRTAALALLRACFAFAGVLVELAFATGISPQGR